MSEKNGETDSALLPEGAVESHRLTVVSYIDQNGENAYVVVAKGEAPQSSYLGMTLQAQQEILEW